MSDSFFGEGLKRSNSCFSSSTSSCLTVPDRGSGGDGSIIGSNAFSFNVTPASPLVVTGYTLIAVMHDSAISRDVAYHALLHVSSSHGDKRLIAGDREDDETDDYTYLKQVLSYASTPSLRTKASRYFVSLSVVMPSLAKRGKADEPKVS